MRQRAFTLIELLVVISIIAVLAAMLLPAIGLVRNQARSSRCQSNLRQIGMACEAYVQDAGAYPDVFFPKETSGTMKWNESLEPYLEAEGDTADSVAALRDARGVMRSCPAWRLSSFYDPLASTKIGYGLNEAPFKWSGGAAFDNKLKVVNPNVVSGVNMYRTATPANVRWKTTRPLVGDCYGFNMLSTGSEGFMRHGKTANHVFYDGHVASLTPAASVAALDKPDLGP